MLNSNCPTLQNSITQAILYSSSYYYQYIVFKHLPDGYAPFYPRSMSQFPVHIFNSLHSALPPRYLNDFEILQDSLSQWYCFIPDSVKNYLRDSCIDDQVLLLRPIHGDTLSPNILRNSDGTTILSDFESFCEYGPFLVDSVGFWLCINFQSLKYSPAQTSERLLLEFGHHGLPNIILSLSYLCYCTGHLVLSDLIERIILDSSDSKMAPVKTL